MQRAVHAPVLPPIYGCPRLYINATLLKWQYVKCGRIAALKRCNLASVGIRFLSLIITPILWLAFLQTLLICKLKFRPQSIVTPRSSKLSDSIICLPLTVILVCHHSSHFYYGCSSFDIFSGFPEEDLNRTN